MGTSLVKYPAVIAQANKKSDRAIAVYRKARVAVVLSRIMLLFTGLIFLFIVMNAIWSWSVPSPYIEGMDPAERIAATHEAEGRLLFTFFLLLAMYSFTYLSRRLARKWARAASELQSGSETENWAVLQQCLDANEPIALYLRGFDEEQRSWNNIYTIPSSPGIFSMRPSRAWRALFSDPSATTRLDKETRWVEAEIVDQLRGYSKQMFCIANPSDTFLLPGALRVRVDHENWVADVSNLVRRARLVLFYITKHTPGVAIELQLIKAQRAKYKCVVITNNRSTQDDKDTIDDFATIILAPSLSSFNRTTDGPRFGRSRFRQELQSGIEKVLNTE